MNIYDSVIHKADLVVDNLSVQGDRQHYRNQRIHIDTSNQCTQISIFETDGNEIKVFHYGHTSPTKVFRIGEWLTYLFELAVPCEVDWVKKAITDDHSAFLPIDDANIFEGT